jgi:hypothetical protein
MSTKSLQQELALTTAKFELKEFASSKLGSIKHNAYLSGHDDEGKTISIDAETIQEAAKVLILCPPTNSTTTIGSATKHKAILNTPFRIDIDNPCTPNQYRNFTIGVHYTSTDIEVRLSVPITDLVQFMVAGERHVSDSEYHYFSGYTHQQLSKLKVRCYSFNGPQINWYGGSKTATSETLISEIIETIKNAK